MYVLITKSYCLSYLFDHVDQWLPEISVSMLIESMRVVSSSPLNSDTQTSDGRPSVAIILIVLKPTTTAAE